MIYTLSMYSILDLKLSMILKLINKYILKMHKRKQSVPLIKSKFEKLAESGSILTNIAIQNIVFKMPKKKIIQVKKNKIKRDPNMLYLLEGISLRKSGSLLFTERSQISNCNLPSPCNKVSNTLKSIDFSSHRIHSKQACSVKNIEFSEGKDRLLRLSNLKIKLKKNMNLVSKNSKPIIEISKQSPNKQCLYKLSKFNKTKAREYEEIELKLKDKLCKYNPNSIRLSKCIQLHDCRPKSRIIIDVAKAKRKYGNLFK